MTDVMGGTHEEFEVDYAGAAENAVGATVGIVKLADDPTLEGAAKVVGSLGAVAATVIPPPAGMIVGAATSLFSGLFGGGSQEPSNQDMLDALDEGWRGWQWRRRRGWWWRGRWRWRWRWRGWREELILGLRGVDTRGAHLRRLGGGVCRRRLRWRWRRRRRQEPARSKSVSGAEGRPAQRPHTSSGAAKVAVVSVAVLGELAADVAVFWVVSVILWCCALWAAARRRRCLAPARHFGARRRQAEGEDHEATDRRQIDALKQPPESPSRTATLVMPDVRQEA